LSLFIRLWLRPPPTPPHCPPQEDEVTGLRWVPIDQVADLLAPPELPALINAAANATALRNLTHRQER
jgi:hypothetical protein